MTAAAPKSLAEALALLQGQLPRVAKEHPVEIKKDGRVVGKYAYADLTDVSVALLPVLASLGLFFSCTPGLVSGRFVRVYFLKHVSGEEIGGEYPLPDPDRLGPQDLGKAITYARRYALCAVTGLAPGGDDDDAQSAEQARRDTQTGPAVQRKPRTAPDAQLEQEGRMTRGQLAEHKQLEADTKRQPKRAERTRPQAPQQDPWNEDHADYVTRDRAAELRGDQLTEPEDKPGSILDGQHRALERLLSMLDIETDNRATRHALCAGWAGLDDLASLSDLSMTQAAACIRAAQGTYDKDKARA